MLTAGLRRGSQATGFHLDRYTVHVQQWQIFHLALCRLLEQMLRVHVIPDAQIAEQTALYFLSPFHACIIAVQWLTCRQVADSEIEDCKSFSRPLNEVENSTR